MGSGSSWEFIKQVHETMSLQILNPFNTLFEAGHTSIGSLRQVTHPPAHFQIQMPSSSTGHLEALRESTGERCRCCLADVTCVFSSVLLRHGVWLNWCRSTSVPTAVELAYV